VWFIEHLGDAVECNPGCVAYSLDSNQQAKRVTVSEELLAVLQCDKPSDFEHIITGNESCSFRFIQMSPSELRLAMAFRKESNKASTWKNAIFLLFGMFMDSTALLIFTRANR
jgi:hypothetical protein